MIRIRFSLVFIFLWIGLTACEHKDLCYDHPHFATVRVIFDWTKISNHDKPEGMRVVFYPTDDESNTWIFDFPGGEGGEDAGLYKEFLLWANSPESVEKKKQIYISDFVAVFGRFPEGWAQEELESANGTEVAPAPEEFISPETDGAVNMDDPAV